MLSLRSVCEGRASDLAAVQLAAVWNDQAQDPFDLAESELLPQHQRPQHRLLFGDQRLHSLAGQADHLTQLLLIKHLMLGRGLHFDELSSPPS